MKNILLILLLTSVSVMAQVPPPRPQPTPGAGKNVNLPPAERFNLSQAELNKVYGKDEINFNGVTIDEFLTVYADTVNRTILRPANLPAPTITVRNQTPLTRREVIQLMDAELALNGIVMIPVGEKFVKAMPVAEAGGGGAKIEHGPAKDLPEMGQYVTHVVQLKYTKPSEMLPIIQPFAKIPNSIIPIEANGILVIRDYAENVKRMLEMIEQVDVDVPEEYVSEVIPIKYALAGDIATALNSLSGSSSGTSVGSSAGGGRTSSRTTSRGGFGTGLGGVGGAYNNQANRTGVGGAGGVGTTGGSTFTERLRNIVARASAPTASGDITVIGQTKIIADERTNSLLVYATRKDMVTIKDVVSKLDVVLAQVLIESLILGVQTDNSFELGVSAAQDPKNLGPNAVGAGVMNNDKDLLGTGLSWISGQVSSNALTAIPTSGGLNYFGQINQDWNVAVKAISSRGKTEVLQRPVIMTTHATPGQFFVGRTVPYVTSSYYGGYGGYGPSSSYQQLRVGIQLTVTPFINPDGIVVMKIDQAIEDISGSTRIEGVGDVPNTASRTLSADVTVRDRDTIILGGFMNTTGTKNKSGVPLLKDIPILGALFSNRSDTKSRQELLVLMRPTVLKTPELAAVGSKIERERMPTLNEFENRIAKENAAADKKLDNLSNTMTVEPVNPPHVPAVKGDEGQTGEPRHAVEEKQKEMESQPPQPNPAPAAPPVEAPPPAAKPEESSLSTPSQAQPVRQSAGNHFRETRPMTEEELRAYGRIPATP